MVMAASGRATRSSSRCPMTTARAKTVQKTLNELVAEVDVAAAGAVDVAVIEAEVKAGHVVGAEVAVVVAEEEEEVEARSRAQVLVRCFAGTERKASASSSLMMAVRISSATFLA